MIYEINYDEMDLWFPKLFTNSGRRNSWFFNPKYVVIIIINGIYDFLNYFFFIFLHFIVDLVLLKKFKKTIKEKQETMRQMKRAVDLEKALIETEDSKRRAVNMVILNSVFNLVTKVPSMISPLNDMILLAQGKREKNTDTGMSFFYFNFYIRLTLRVYCGLERSCQLFQSFGNFLFLLSSSLVFFFLKSFDMNFKDAFKIAFFRDARKKIEDKSPNYQAVVGWLSNLLDILS